MKTIIALFIALPLMSQQFEVASVKPSKAPTEDSMISGKPGGRLSAQNVNLLTLIQVAYAVSATQIKGGPAWLKTARFDVEAKTGGTEEKLREMREQLKALLMERFGLEVSTSEKDTVVQSLILLRTPAPSKGGVGAIMANHHLMRGEGVLLKDVAKRLSDVVGSVVVDATEYASPVDLDMSWAQPEDPVVAGVDKPSLTAALKDSGFALRSAHGSVTVLTVVRAVTPEEN